MFANVQGLSFGMVGVAAAGPVSGAANGGLADAAADDDGADATATATATATADLEPEDEDDMFGFGWLDTTAYSGNDPYEAIEYLEDDEDREVRGRARLC